MDYFWVPWRSSLCASEEYRGLRGGGGEIINILALSIFPEAAQPDLEIFVYQALGAGSTLLVVEHNGHGIFDCGSDVITF